MIATIGLTAIGCLDSGALMSSQPGGHGETGGAAGAPGGAGRAGTGGPAGAAGTSAPSACAGGPCPVTVLAADQMGPQTLVVTGGKVYWSNHNGNAIMAVSTEGGAPEVVVGGLSAPVVLALDDNNLYWADDVDRTVMSAPRGGGSPTILARDQGQTYTLAVDALNVYWSSYDDGAVRRVPIGGGAIATLASGEVNPGPLILLGGNLYWPRVGAGIFVLPLAGGAGHAVPLQDFQPLSGFAIDGDGVYWTTFTGGGVYRAPLAGGATTPLALGQGQVQCLLVDPPWVYFTTVDDDYAIGRVMRVQMDGEALTTIAVDQVNPCGLAVDATSIYWDEVIAGGARILKAAK